MAHALNMSQNNYSKIERGKNKPTLDVLEKICNIFGVSLTKLIEFDAEKTIFNVYGANNQNGNIVNEINPTHIQDLYKMWEQHFILLEKTNEKRYELLKNTHEEQISDLQKKFETAINHLKQKIN
jgi:transcriptional regulator with XRE-family HTH domain